MAQIDKDLAAALKQAKTRTMYFALVESKPGEGTLIVNKDPVKQKAIDEAKKDLGGGHVIKGRCSSNEGGHLVFETAKEPAGSLKVTLNAVIKRDTGQALKVEAQRAADLTDDDDQDGADAKAVTPATSKDATAPPDKAEVIKRLTDLAEPYKKIMAGPVAKGPEATSLHTQMDTAKALIAKQDWATAAKSLDEVQRLVSLASIGETFYDTGLEDGKAKFTVPRPNHRQALAKYPKFSTLLHYYDEGFAKGDAEPNIGGGGDNQPHMDVDNRSPEQREEDDYRDKQEVARKQRLHDARKKAREMGLPDLSGGGDVDPEDPEFPHTHDDKEPGEVVDPNVEGAP